MNVTPTDLNLLRRLHANKRYQFFPIELHEMVDKLYWINVCEWSVHTNYRYIATISNFLRNLLIEWDDISSEYNEKKYATAVIRLLSNINAKCNANPDKIIALQNSDNFFAALNGSTSSKTPRIYAIINIFVHFIEKSKIPLERNIASNVARGLLSKLYLFYIVRYSPKRMTEVVVPWHAQYPQFRIRNETKSNSIVSSPSESQTISNTNTNSVQQTPIKQIQESSNEQIPESPIKQFKESPMKQMPDSKTTIDPFTILIEIYKSETRQSKITDSEMNALMLFFAETEGNIAATIAKVFEQCQAAFYHN